MFLAGAQRVKRSLPIFVLGLAAGCGGQPSGSESGSGVSDPGRRAFESVALPDGNTLGPDTKALARSLYGSAEPVEGNYSEEVVKLSDSGIEQLVLFTRLDLPDDSLRGLRYRLEFMRQGGQWQLAWAGRQVSCWPGRGHEDWGIPPCR